MSIRPPRTPLWLALAVACAALLAAPPSRADEAAEARQLLAAGDAAAALSRVDRALTTSPSDPSLRFLRAVILGDLKRDDEALQAYLQLTQDHPDLAAPYNNLAVQLAARGRLDEARAALESALRMDPGNRTASQNLGDVHLRLAIQAWERSTRPDRPDAALQRRLQLARELLAGTAAAAGR